jgi:carbonic anhydrase
MPDAMKPQDAAAIASISNLPPSRYKITDLPLSPGQLNRSQPAKLTADQALRKLIAGNQRFINKRTTEADHLTRLEKAAPQQTPFATILGCSDSRVPIEVIFDQGLGDLFVIRVAGNVVTPTEIASVEYGTSVLQTKVLLVLGHRSCGAVSAALKGGHLMGQMNVLIDAIQPAVSRSTNQPGDRVENAVRENVFLQMERLQQSSVVARLLDERQIKLVGGYFDLNTGQVSIFKVLTSSQSAIRVNRIYAF